MDVETKKLSHKAAIREENEKAILEAAETVFAARGYLGATTNEIAQLAGVPKANLHYYFSTKEALYRRVLDDIMTVWLGSAGTFDDCDDPKEALPPYIHAKMEFSRERPKGSKIWAAEIMQGAPHIQDFLETTLQTWMDERKTCVEGWIKDGKINPLKPEYLFYMIWSVTQHYADFQHQIDTLNGNKSLSDHQFAEARDQATEIILRGIGAIT